jgi:hypothetical protein
MNNTTNLLTIATITALLLMGTSVMPMQSYASGSDQHQKHKDTKDLKSSISEKTQIDKKSASQHQDQDNFCYRGDDCQQANEGQQIVGKDNEANGFNDQSDNPLPQSNSSASSSPSTSTSTPTSTTPTSTTPTSTTPTSTTPSTQPGAGSTTTTNIIPSPVSECSIDQTTNTPITLTCVR